MWQIALEEADGETNKVVAVSGHEASPLMRRESQLLFVGQAITSTLMGADHVEAQCSGNHRDLVGQVFVEVEAHLASHQDGGMRAFHGFFLV